MTAVDTLESERFLFLLGGNFTFQTFRDSKANVRGRDQVATWMHGNLAEHADKLADLNARGAGVFVMVNEGNGRGRATRNVQRIRAYFADFDGTQPPDASTVPLAPHAIIESSPGRWHWYWFVDGARLETFKAAQVAIADRFGSDRTVSDLPRVMRLPGFVHRKAEPFRTRIVELRDSPRYAHADFMEAFDIDLQPATARNATVAQPPTAQRRKRTLPTAITDGERNATLLSLAAGLVRNGHDALAINRRLQRINAERCRPPLCATEVDTIAMRAIGYGSYGFSILPDRLLDSAEWRALPPPAHDLILAAYRRFDGFNNGNIALPWADFKDLNGFKNETTFGRHRTAVVQSGILVEARKARYTQRGITPTLYAIAERFLHISLPADCGGSATSGLCMPYIDKQALSTERVASDRNTRLRASAQPSRQEGRR